MVGWWLCTRVCTTLHCHCHTVPQSRPHCLSETTLGVRVLTSANVDTKRRMFFTETDGCHVSCISCNVDWTDKVDRKINHQLPIIRLSWNIIVSYAARVVDDQSYVEKTRCILWSTEHPLFINYCQLSNHAVKRDSIIVQEHWNKKGKTVIQHFSQNSSGMMT